jgi:hypothetical protein
LDGSRTHQEHLSTLHTCYAALQGSSYERSSAHALKRYALVDESQEVYQYSKDNVHGLPFLKPFYLLKNRIQILGRVRVGYGFEFHPGGKRKEA